MLSNIPLMIVPFILFNLGLMGLFVFITLTALEKAPLLAKKDPFFEESVHHHI